jgi:phage virion morphogenesis protein
MAFDVDISVREDVTATLARLTAAGADLTPAMRDIAGHLADETRERFEEGRDPQGVPWKPSRRVLGLDGSKEGYGPHQVDSKTLILSGDLLSSITEEWGSNYAAVGPEASGGAAVYAAIHQTGGTITPKRGAALSFGGMLLASVTIPKREYLGFTDGDADYTMGVLIRHLDGSGASA